jgi:hypothetical protein
MNIFDKIMAFIKLPYRIIVLIAIILGLLLFLPKNMQEILKLNSFIDEYGRYFGIAFLFSIGYIIFVFFPFIVKILFAKYINKKLLKNLKMEISNLSNPDVFLLREFFLQNKDVIEVPIENTEFVDLFNKNILIMTSKNLRGFIFGTFVPVRINPIIKEYITPEILQLPKTKLTKQEVEKIKSERPLFVSQISYINNLFNFPWMHIT